MGTLEKNTQHLCVTAPGTQVLGQDPLSMHCIFIEVTQTQAGQEAEGRKEQQECNESANTLSPMPERAAPAHVQVYHQGFRAFLELVHFQAGPHACLAVDPHWQFQDYTLLASWERGS